MEDYAENSFNVIPISMEYIRDLRTATSFRVYVIYIDLVLILALFLSIHAIRELTSKQLFSKSITHLLIASLVYGNVHNASYTIIETWSLYRSFAYSDNMTAIMFTSEECFVQHVLNSCVRFLFIAIELALNVDRIIVILFRKHFHCYPGVRGEILNILAVILSFALGCLLHLKGPHPGIVTTSCFRETDITINLCSTNLTSYTILSACCAALDFLMMWYTWNDRKKINYDLNSQYLKVEQHHSLMAVSLNSLLQLFVTSIYAISMFVLANMSMTNPELGNANLLRWFYTTPYSTLLVPIQIKVFIQWIGNRRKRRINTATRVSLTQDGYFTKLSDSWK
ncbi:Serpentine receptor class alpha-32 [Caenorhabditis elegans]|uniref:Serpentine receptor class alpha-32 n=1 Tax=Caenorhabditis elegans TaxID=6239 RepID=SRA32_CAEEL|nr:Serpentine receptor class alpha-32 [Caenorhabditis elegans]Q10934.2 RecName: Full=Serpentine receptor class alpha-32; Short=Protein sra-32 [Caenorhabditis elegans]CCD61737.1 Serpentine receptor class alpha-32 [Caenorhabditis elegans]|eukprot:NP_494801.2 Serpentine receptor class alpha-32 [Caenorhabditis elegans]